MKVRSFEVKRVLRDVWPELWPRLRRHTYLFDRYYWLPRREEVEAFLVASSVDRMRFIDEFADCDDFALLTHAEAKKVRITMWDEIPREEWVPWAVGEVAGREFRGMRTLHMINLWITRDAGVLLSDASQGDRIWQARATYDSPFWIRF